jgi:hypothetical protein
LALQRAVFIHLTTVFPKKDTGIAFVREKANPLRKTEIDDFAVLQKELLVGHVEMGSQSPQIRRRQKEMP